MHFAGTRARYVQTNVLNAIESTLELVHPMEMAQQALPTDHLLARIQQLEKDLDKSQEEACKHSQHLVHQREQVRLTKTELESTQAHLIRLQPQLDDVSEHSCSRGELDKAEKALVDGCSG
eukprot:CAMPEP_0179449716 /NCGR_PEP_ID=MMETSP0799-20121207/33595_1 /TAXON_ID=46947 /ORGANISM="Geminigera cryophila, Strain CCMP2564" /LENGTH=120 /DNA_ID=CAMNT_0021242903 /DNA_START=553 /DNA_END=915 /DNA_ORIENTATION=-